MKDEKYINIKKEYIILFIVCVVYSAICIISRINFDSSYSLIEGEPIFIFTFWLFSLIMGVCFYIYTKAIMFSTMVWFAYSGLMELIICKTVYGICFLTTLLFFISMFVTKLLEKPQDEK